MLNKLNYHKGASMVDFLLFLTHHTNRDEVILKFEIGFRAILDTTCSRFEFTADDKAHVFPDKK